MRIVTELSNAENSSHTTCTNHRNVQYKVFPRKALNIDPLVEIQENGSFVWV